MNKQANVLYKDSNEKYMAAVTLYPNSSNVLCYDVDKKLTVSSTELANLALKSFVWVNTATGTYNQVVSVKPSNSDAVATTVTVMNGTEAKTYNSGTVK